MTSILTEWSKKCLEKLIKGAIAEARFVFCFTCIAKEFEEERERLKAERETLGQHAKVAKGNNKDIPANVVFWEEEVDKLIQEDAKANQTCFFGFCPDCIWRYKRGKELANGTNDIKRLTDKGEKFGNIELPRRLPDVVRYSSQDYIPFKSRESEYKELLDALKDDDNYITGLQGMGGTGKTTLAKEVGKELKESGQFTHVIDTTISFTPDIKKIQDDIAGPLGLKWEDCNESDRPKILWDRLTNGEKILLIMDDVWDQDPLLDFDAIGIPERDNHNGCRVLVTTRSRQIYNKMNFDKSIELGLLSKEDAWIMFKRYAGISNGSLKHVTDKGRKIAKECKQLPVAIAVIASSLKGQQHRVHEWDVTLKSLKKHISIHGVDDDMVGIYKCLKFSYDHMKDEKAKGLFLLCSVFPEDEEISVENLSRLCIGSGLFGEDYGNYDDARNQVVVAKNKLLDSCLLLEVEENSVKMHDLIRDVAQWIANKEILGVNLSDKNQKSLIKRETNIRCLLYEGKHMDLFSCKFDGSKLETLIVKVDKDEDLVCMEVPTSFFENICELRVLHFTSDFYQQLSLQQSIQLLTNIRSLLVNAFDLGDISVLGNLQSLQTLDLDDCTINELPNEITKLKEFKLLSLKNCIIRQNNPFEVIERCPSLEELYFINSFDNVCGEITLPELQRYHICNGICLLSDSLSKCVNFKANGKNFLSKGTLKYFMRTAKFVQLSGVHGESRNLNEGEWRNLIPDIVPIDHGMNDLVELHLFRISGLQFLIDNIGSQVPIVLSKLLVLKLFDMNDLVMLFNGPISFDSLKNLENLSIDYCEQMKRLFKCKLNFCSLKTIKLKHCTMLVSIFQLSTSQSLVQLETLEIYFCDGLKKIVDETRDEESIQEIYGGSMFPKLKYLYIFGCPSLEYIFPFLSAQGLPELETIYIRSCDGLKYIFCQYQYVDLGSLRQLKLSALPNFIDIFQEYTHPTSSFVRGSSSTSKAEKELESIKCNIFSWTHMCCHGDQPPQDYYSESKSFCFDKWERPQCLSKIMSNIKEIELENVGKIKSIFIPMLLETLRIEKCSELKIIDTGDGGNNWGNVFPKLKLVEIKNCEQMEYIFGHYADYHQHHTEIHLRFPVLEHVFLSNLPSLVDMCPKQYHTTFSVLAHLRLNECSQVANKSIGHFITNHSVAKSMDGTIMKELSVNMLEHFLPLKDLVIKNSKVESIFCLNEVNKHKMNLGLQDIDLLNLPMMTSLFVGPKDSYALKNLDMLKIVRCEKLEIVFSTAIVRCLPQLRCLIIKECKELKHIIQDDVENEKGSNNLSSRTSFPMLDSLAVINCNKLKCVFPISESKELPMLRSLMISETDELEEIFKSEGDDQKVEIPSLNFVAFENLPSLFQTQGIHFQAVENSFVHNCQKYSLTSALTSNTIDDIYDIDFNSEIKLRKDFPNLFKQLQKDFYSEQSSSETTEVEATSGHGFTSSQIQMKQALAANHKYVENVPDLEILQVEILPASSEELMNEQSLDQQHCLGEIDTTIKHSQGNNFESSTSKTTLSTISGARNEALIQFVSPKQKGIEISVEEGTTSTIAKTITSSTHLELVSSSSGLLVTSEYNSSTQEYGDGQIAIPFFPPSTTEPLTIEDFDVIDYLEITQTNNDQGEELWDRISFLNEDAFKKVSSMNVEQFPIASQFPSKDFGLYLPVESVFQQFQEESKGHDNGNENPNAQTTKEFLAWIEVQEALGQKLTSSKIKMKQTPEAENEFVENVPDLEISSIALLPTNSEELMNEPPKDDGFRVSESKPSPSNSIPLPLVTFQTPPMPSEGNPSQIIQNSSSPYIVMWELETVTPSAHLELVSSSQEQEVDVRSSLEITKTKNDQVSLNDDAFIQLSSIIDEQFPKDDDFRDSKFKPSPSNSIPLPLASQTPSMPFEGNPSQIVENSSSPSLVMRELEQLVSENYLDCDNFSLLTDFLVKHPSVLLRDTSLSNRYKGYAYGCLAELLQFLQTHSVLDVLGSSRSKFVKLLQDVRSFAFDKDWLDSVERRALFLDIQVSQDEFEKLLDSKQQVTKEVEVLRFKIDILSQNVEDLKHQLTSSEAVLETIVQQETQVLETKAALSAPLGY